MNKICHKPFFFFKTTFSKVHVQYKWGCKQQRKIFHKPKEEIKCQRALE